MSDMSIEDSDVDSNLQIGNDILINEDNSGLSVISDNAQSLNESGKNQTQLSSKTNEIYYQGYYSLTLTDMNSNTLWQINQSFFQLMRSIIPISQIMMVLLVLI